MVSCHVMTYFAMGHNNSVVGVARKIILPAKLPKITAYKTKLLSLRLVGSISYS